MSHLFDVNGTVKVTFVTFFDKYLMTTIILKFRRPVSFMYLTRLLS